MLCRLYLKRKDRRKGKTLPVPSVSLRMKFTHLPSPTRPCFLNTDPWLSLSASGPLHLLVLLPGMLFIQIIACHVPSFYSGTFNYKLNDNLRFQSTAFFHRLEPSFPARCLRAFLSLFPTPAGYTCVWNADEYFALWNQPGVPSMSSLLKMGVRISEHWLLIYVTVTSSGSLMAAKSSKDQRRGNTNINHEQQNSTLIPG